MVDRITLNSTQEDLLQLVVEAARNTPQDQRIEFIVTSTFGGDFLIHPGVPDNKSKVYTGDVEILASEGLLMLRRRSRASASFDITPRGFLYYEQLMQRFGETVERVESSLKKYLRSAEFRREYPEALRRWSIADSLLWRSDTQKQLTTIGHHCREAIQEFANTLVDRFQPPDAPTNKSRSVARLRAVFDFEAQRMGSTEKSFLKALLAYWGTVNDLIQRQEHGAQKEGEELIWEDARRIVFQTIVVMYEVDRSLQA